MWRRTEYRSQGQRGGEADPVVRICKIETICLAVDVYIKFVVFILTVYYLIAVGINIRHADFCPAVPIGAKTPAVRFRLQTDRLFLAVFQRPLLRRI